MCLRARCASYLVLVERLLDGLEVVVDLEAEVVECGLLRLVHPLQVGGDADRLGVRLLRHLLERLRRRLRAVAHRLHAGRALAEQQLLLRFELCAHRLEFPRVRVELPLQVVGGLCQLVAQPRVRLTQLLGRRLQPRVGGVDPLQGRVDACVGRGVGSAHLLCHGLERPLEVAAQLGHACDALGALLGQSLRHILQLADEGRLALINAAVGLVGALLDQTGQGHTKGLGRRLPPPLKLLQRGREPILERLHRAAGRLGQNLVVLVQRRQRRRVLARHRLDAAARQRQLCLDVSLVSPQVVGERPDLAVALLPVRLEGVRHLEGRRLRPLARLPGVEGELLLALHARADLRPQHLLRRGVECFGGLPHLAQPPLPLGRLVAHHPLRLLHSRLACPFLSLEPLAGGAQRRTKVLERLRRRRLVLVAHILQLALLLVRRRQHHLQRLLGASTDLELALQRVHLLGRLGCCRLLRRHQRLFHLLALCMRLRLRRAPLRRLLLHLRLRGPQLV